MSQPERFDVLVLGSGTGGKLIAWHLARSGQHGGNTREADVDLTDAQLRRALSGHKTASMTVLYAK
jgi:glycine/D-amino acid oxidase-like deaminating enzyme